MILDWSRTDSSRATEHVCKKEKWSRYRPGVAQRVGRGIALIFHDRGTRKGWVVGSTPRPHFTPGKDSVPILQEAVGGPQVRSGRTENLVPTGIRSRTVQPVVSRYTDWATRPTNMYVHKYTKLHIMYVVTMTIYWSNVVKQAIHTHKLHWSRKHIHEPRPVT